MTATRFEGRTDLLEREAPIVDPPAEMSIIELFWDRVRRQPQRPALRVHLDGEWRGVSWGAYGESVEEVAAGLLHLGIAPGDRVAILASNQRSWHEADLGILSAGAVSVPAYSTSASGQIAYVLEHSASRVCFVGDSDQLAKVLLQRHRLPALERVIVLGDASDGLDDGFVLCFDDLRSLGRDRLAEDADCVSGRVAAIGPSALATIVYTSGTTGTPKGAELTYANLSAAIGGITRVISIGPEDRFLSFLPLSHVAERIVSHFGQIVSGGETWFARSLSTVPDDLQACRPTLFFAVPRVWEKFQAAILDEIVHSPAPLRQLGEAYLRLAAARSAADRAHKRLGPALWLGYAVADRVVGAKIRAGAGLDEARVLVSGAAPIAPELLWWFHGVGLPIHEVYGQTEDCGPTSLNSPGHGRIGSVGLPLPGLEVRIAPDGEILARGPSVTHGYHLDPDTTGDLLDGDGWMHSGDLGHLDADGYLFVTGRKKDLIVTSSGKNIAPQDAEVRLQADPLISQAVVVGDGRSYLAVLIGLDSDAVAHWADGRGKVAHLESLLSDPDLREEISAAVDRVNLGRSPIEQIKVWRLLPGELTVASGELTPTLKVRRDVVTGRYAALIAEMYA